MQVIQLAEKASTKSAIWNSYKSKFDRHAGNCIFAQDYE